jgi:hypothetical protein
MNLKNKIVVEQLDDERLTNIERKLVVAVSDMKAPAARSSHRMLAFAGMAMALGVAGIVGYKLRGTDAPIVATPTEEVQTFAISTDKSHTVDLGDAQLTSGPSSHLVVERAKHRVVVRMTRGSIDMQVKHDPSRVLVVQAGDTEIEDIGTHFTVDYDGASHVAVRVTEGEVKVKRAGKHVDIEAGFAWTENTGKLTLAALDQQGVTIASATPPIVQPQPAPSIDAPKLASSVSLSGGTGSAGGDAPRSGSAAQPVHKPGKTNAHLALDKLAIEEPIDVGTRDPNTAISKYLEMAVSMGDNQDKTQLLYSIAVIQHRSKQDRAALYTLSGVIKRQGGKAYKPALWLNVRIECMQRFDDECRQAADLYLRKVPDGPAAGVAQTILTEISRAQSQ